MPSRGNVTELFRRKHNPSFSKAPCGRRLFETKQMRVPTNLQESVGAETVQTVEQRVDVEAAEDVDPLKSLHL